MRRLIVGLFGLSLGACAGDDVPETAGTTDASTGGTSSGTTSTSSSTTGGTAEAASDTEASGSSEGSTAQGSEATSLETLTASSSSDTTDGTTMETSTTESSTSGGTDTGETDGLLPNGDSCMANAECSSGNCYLVGVLGGVCGECLTDDDCFWGCGLPNPLAAPPTGSTCDDGSLGAGCMSDDACQMSLVCTEVIDVPGVVTMQGCSECAIDADCPELCSPNYESAITELEGHWECVDADSLVLGSGCDLAGTGDDACASGFCAAAEVMGLLQIGICSECEIDNDCGAAETCSAPNVELDGTVTPGACI